MELILKDIGSRICVSDKVYGSAFNESLVHQVVTSYRSGLRQGTRAQKNRARVSGSGKKPWRQKGTGRARSGSIRSPIWRSGGVTFAAQPKCYKKKVNKKMYRGALKSIFSELIRQNRLVPVSTFFIEKPRTKLLLEELKKIELYSDVLIIVNDRDKNLFLASRNLYGVKVCHFSNLDPFILVAFNTIVMTVKSIKNIEDILV